MRERWKPKHGEDYYFIDFAGCIGNYEWRGDSTDCLCHKCGNCFRTKAEAEAAVEKVKELLLSLHDNGTSTANSETLKDKPLPKLTAEVFDRPDCPEWAKYVAVDSDGDARYHERYPRLSTYWWVSDGNIKAVNYDKFDASDWQNSLIERPVKKPKLPDWCKVGAWVWSVTFNTYFKVDKVDGVFISGTNFSGSDYCVAIENVLQARLRPYNAEEMRGMVGKVIDNPRSSRLVTAYNESDCIKILTSIGWYTADDLMTSDYTIDGKPCGMLEHLDDKGEWVE